jgi:phage-related protein (TIGR01555 family)
MGALMKHKNMVKDQASAPGTKNKMIADGFTNILKGVGRKGIDPQKSNGVALPRILSEAELVALYTGDGLASRIVNVVADDMVRNGWEILGDNDGVLYKEQQKLSVKKILRDAIIWARLFGGSMVVMETEGGGSLSSPLVPYKGKPVKIKKLRIYPRYRVTLDDMAFGKSVTSDFYDTYEYFTINKKYGGSFKIHASRCLIFRGLPNPETNLRIANTDDDFWGISVLQPIWDTLSSLGICLSTAGTLASEFSVGKYKLAGLEEILHANDVDAIMTRITTMQASKGILNAILIGKEDEYIRDTLNFTGLPEMIDRLFMVLSGVTAIPVTRLFGRSAAGANATGESDSMNYYDGVESQQETELMGPLSTLMNLINSGLGSPVAEEDCTVEFLPVWAPNSLQQVEMVARQAAADQIYLQAGVISADEVRKMRFSGGYAFEQSLESTEEGSAPGIPEPPGGSMTPPSAIGGRNRSKPKAKVAPLANQVRKR